MPRQFRYPILLATSLAWNVLIGAALIAVVARWQPLFTGRPTAAALWMGLAVLVISPLLALGAVLAGRWSSRATGVGARALTGEVRAYSAAFWPLALFVAPAVGGVVLLAQADRTGAGGPVVAFAAIQAVCLVVAPTRVLSRLYRLQASRTLAQVREVYRPDGVCPDCGLSVESQDVRLAPLHPAAWLLPLASVLAVAIGLGTLVVLTMPGSVGINGQFIWWSWRGAALLALPVYLVLVSAWVLPRWVIMRPVRIIRSRRLASGLCVLCEHGLLAETPTSRAAGA